MTTKTEGESNTPLSAEELQQLIPALATKGELNEWEAQNILTARTWALSERNLKATDPFSDSYVRELHWRMFDQTWKWAGTYRNTEKNLGVPVAQMRELLMALFGDARYWTEHQTYPIDEIAARFHHRLVAIHVFPNGNGRHARLLADVVAKKNAVEVFSWGCADMVRAGDARKAYIDALHAADNGDIQPLLNFCRS
jgi:Fic-DOC domain mobile mystery protein B